MSNLYEEMQVLIKEIKQHNKRYYADGKPTISDLEYDKLLQRLAALENENKDLIDPLSPTKHVGEKPLKAFPKHKHSVLMLSINNTYSIDDFNNFIKRIEKALRKQSDYVIEPKIDGVAISLLYKKGKLQLALTRGDGKIGSDVTANIKTIKSIPLMLSDDIDIEVRGEIFFPKKAFALFNEKQAKNNKETFINPRNAAAGSIKLLSDSIVKERPLDCFFYSLVQYSKNSQENQFDRIQFIKKQGFKTNPHTTLFSSLEDMQRYIIDWESKKDELDYDTDGLVIKLNSIAGQEELGHTMKAPRWAIAYKYPTTKVETRITDIELSVGVFGNITPIALLEPVVIGNTTVSKASLHNFGEITRKDIRINDLVFVEKSGEIIPQIHSVILERRPTNALPFTIPKLCSCGSLLEDDIVIKLKCTNEECLKTAIEFKHKAKVASSYDNAIYPGIIATLLKERKAYLPAISCPYCKELLEQIVNINLRCTNSVCSYKTIRRISNFASKNAMDIEDLGTKIISSLVEKELISDYADLYYLTEKDILALDGFKDKSATKIISNIEKSKNMPPNALIKGLGIPHIGAKQSLVLMQKYKSIDEVMTQGIEPLKKVVGEKAAEMTYLFFRNKENRAIIEKLRNANLSFETNLKENTNKLFFLNKRFVLTGALEKFSRKEAFTLISENGGECSSALPSKSTDFLIVGENPGKRKLDKAAELNTAIIYEKDLLKQL